MDDLDKTIPPRSAAGSGMDDVTMPGRRDRKPDGRFSVGDLIMNRYKVLAELGQGGMGVVYKCFDETAGIEIALKALPPELSHNTLEMEDIKDNFQLVHNLHHPNIASSNTLEKDDSNGNYYLIMECCEGEDLRRWIKRKRKAEGLKFEEVLPIIQQVADALDYAHKQKIIHRDIKPGNIMIAADGTIKVLDFGLAAQIHTSMTRVSMAYHGTSGTGPYMAPEQWRGRAQGAPADQYALAVMTYEMLAGHLPFESSDAAVLKQAVLDETPEEIAGISLTAQNAIKRAMSKEPAQRFENCSDFAAALGGKQIKAGKTVKKGGFGKWGVVLLSTILLVAGGAGYYFASSEEEAPVPEPVSKPAPAPASEPVPSVKPEPKPPVVSPANNISAELEELYGKIVERRFELNQTIDEINAKTYDAPFQVHIKKMNAAFKQLESNLNDLKVTTAANSRLAYLKSMKRNAETLETEIKWIKKNEPLCEQAKSLRNVVQQAKTRADKFSKALNFATYKTAAAEQDSAQKHFDKGEFDSAIKEWRLSEKNYQAAYNVCLKSYEDAINSAVTAKDWEKLVRESEALLAIIPDHQGALKAQRDAQEQIKLERLNKELTSARNAKTEKNWQQVYDRAVAALKIDNSNSEAQNLKQEAENNQKPSLEIIATVDGERVPAEVKFGDSVKDTMKTIQNFTANSNYKGSLNYKRGEVEYVGEVEFTCDWRGPKKMTVALKFTGTVDCNGIALEMVKIKAGNFMMGSPEGELGRENDETQHKVTLTQDYWLGKFEVTQAQYEAIMGNNPSEYKGGNRPVEQVSWNDAKDFCNKLNERYAGKLPAGYKFDLPTEAQWEYACRAGTTTALNNGTNLTSKDGKCSNLNEVGWYWYNNHGFAEHKAIGQKRPNNWGLYDMHGNVYEWCRDWRRSYTGDETDLVGPSSGSDRVVRGGAWDTSAMLCRSAAQFSFSPDFRDDDLGFRLALVPVQ